MARTSSTDFSAKFGSEVLSSFPSFFSLFCWICELNCIAIRSELEGITPIFSHVSPNLAIEIGSLKSVFCCRIGFTGELNKRLFKTSRTVFVSEDTLMEWKNNEAPSVWLIDRRNFTTFLFVSVLRFSNSSYYKK